MRRFGGYANVDARTSSPGRPRSTSASTRSTIPEEELPAGRPLKTDPLYERLLASAAPSMGVALRLGAAALVRARRRGGARRVLVPARQLVRRGRRGVPRGPLRRRRARPDELRQVPVSGPGAEAFLDRLCANRLPARAGPDRARRRCCTPGGGIECDLTVTRVEPERFYVVSAAATETHDYAWIEAPRSGRRLGAPRERDRRYGVLTLAGPAVARAAPAADARRPLPRGVPLLPRAAPPGRRAADARAARLVRRGARLRAAPSARAPARALRPAARGGRADSGSSTSATARSSRCGLEKAYRLWGADMSADYTPLEAGLERFVALRQGRLRRPRGALAPARGAASAAARLPDRRDADGADAARLRAGLCRRRARSAYVTAGGYGHMVERVDRARLPAGRARA